MISVETALEKILNSCSPLPPASLPLRDAAGKTVAQSIQASFPMPLFDNSAMDGYAVRGEDLTLASTDQPVSLSRRSFIAAGDDPTQNVTPGTCCQIATGAPLPPGADAVVMKEAVEATENAVVFRKPAKLGQNVRYRGEDIEEGQPLLRPGQRITPAAVAILAAYGHGNVLVHPSPNVSVVATGSELLAPEEAIQPGKIHDSNSPMLAALIEHAGGQLQHTARVADDPKALQAALEKALSSQVVLISGGVSVGEHDFVKQVLGNLGVEEIFWKVAIKPGKPVFFGRGQSGWVFGLPGNPASAYVIFEVLVRPFLRKLQNQTPFTPPKLQATLLNDQQHHAGRTQYLRAQLSFQHEKPQVRILDFQGSHSLSSLLGANALVEIPPNTTGLKTGAVVGVLPLSEDTRLSTSGS